MSDDNETRTAPVRILAVAGSLREHSYNRGLVRALGQLAPAHVEVEEWTGLAELPAYDADLDASGAPAIVEQLRAAWGSADAIVFATPEYNGSVPGVLKNAVDWASRPRGAAPLRGMQAAVIGTSTGQYGALWAQQDLVRILGIAGARVVGDPVAIPSAREAFTEDGVLVDAQARRRIGAALAALADEAHNSRSAVTAA
jgi:chromate reductase